MSRRTVSFVAGVLLAYASARAGAQAPVAPAPASQAPAPQTTPDAASVQAEGEVDVGARLTGGLGDVGRFQRYADLTSGPTLDRLRYVRQRDAWGFEAAFDHVGYRDQHYAARFDRYGRLRASFDWNQVPLWYSGVSQSPFREELPGVFRLENTIQAAIESKTATIADYASTLRAFDIRSRRDIADARVRYSLTPQLDLFAGYRSTSRSGQQPFGATFGFNNDTEVPLTLDQRTQDVTTAAEWSTARATVRVGYDGSWFDNRVEALIWDNPLRFTDQVLASGYVTGDASSQGRMALAPDSSSHTVSASGSVGLPARTRAFASVSIGSWLQDGQLLPFTINTAVSPIALPRQTAEAEARITSSTLRVTSRPARSVWLNAQYRLYDYDNRTPRFPVTQYVRVDATPFASATGGSEPFEFSRHFVDLDASLTPVRYLAFRAGYGQEHDNRSYRYFEETTENTVRGSIDGTGFSWGSVRLQYDHSVRTGRGLDEQVLGDIGEQVSLRQFDISDRTRDRVSLMVQVSPWDAVGFNVTGAVGQENRPGAAFGLRDNDLRSITVGADVAPSKTVGLGVSYGFENYSTLQRSRQADSGAQFNDPTRDWDTDMNEDVHTWTATFDMRQLTSRTSLSLAYDYVRSTARYLYLVPPDSTLTPPQQLPDLLNAYHRGTADLRYAFTRRVALGLSYGLDKYQVREFGRSPEILTTPLIPGFMNVLYQWRPYDVNTGMVRVIYGF